jgi:plastocyanin
MSAALSGTRKLRRLTGLAAGVALAGTLGVACAPADNPPTVPVSRHGTFVVNVVADPNDAGRADSISVDKSGVPAVAYLLLRPILQEGDIPPAVKPGEPQPPAVVLATEKGGIWSRKSVTPQRNSPKKDDPAQLLGDAPQIANSKGEPGPVVTTDVATDAQGKHHVIWSTPEGLFYSTDASGSFGDPETVSAGPSYGGSIALDSGGTPHVAWLSHNGLKIAARGLDGWTPGDVATLGGNPTQLGLRTDLAAGTTGQFVIAYGDEDQTLVARGPAGGPWTSEAVPGSGGIGVSLALDKDGNPHLAYYDSTGTVNHAHSIGGASWDVTKLASVGPATSNAVLQGLSTGIAVNDKGVHYVTWADPSRNQIMFAQNASGQFASAPVAQSEGGRSPTLAATADGKTVVLAWFDSTNENLDVGETGSGALTIAHPLSPRPTTISGGGGTTTPQCQPNGTDVQVTAQGIAFDTACLAAPVDTAFTITFTNNDAGVPHNVDIYASGPPAAQHLGAANGPSDTIQGPDTTTYDVAPLKAGMYYFQCDIHTNMAGQFVVGEGSGGSSAGPTPSGSASPSPSPSS